ncbi:hypothetical protein [Thermoproteus tenax]|uniref:Uncharacterized protein n=1 Tax=Thermoproteus tenax (strain ATCC 35583 / DSM 2078 / JCM 9277 / NBRC 100435 / Kra 1) TaxID=768679 RepID=G4RMX6_THETK|nr:hypothetical protein [Thermoproteus tenax]CCC80920.1 hypothetical protein TTX_0244 [Thermoproteus tenax Kra 1]
MEIEISYKRRRRPQSEERSQAIVFKIRQTLRSLSFDATPRQPYKFYYRGKKPQKVGEVLEVSAKCNNGMIPIVPWPL